MGRDQMVKLLRERQIRISTADPILDVAALFEVMLEDTTRSIQDVTRTQADRVTAAGVQQVENARQVAAELIKRAGDEAAIRIREAGEEVSLVLARRVDDMVELAENASRFAVRCAEVAGFACAVAAASVIGWVAFHFT